MSQKGVVKFFNARHGFGFIITDSKEVYFNRAALPRDRVYDPIEGDDVEFDIRSSAKGPMAVRIRQPNGSSP